MRDPRRVLLPWLLIRLVWAVIGWFRRNDARNLGELIDTVLLRLAYAPKDWLHNAVTLAKDARDDLARDPATPTGHAVRRRCRPRQRLAALHSR